MTINSKGNTPRMGSILAGGTSNINSSLDIDMAETSESNIAFPIVNSRYEPENKQFISQYNVKKAYTSKF